MISSRDRMVVPLSAKDTVDQARSALKSGKGVGLPELLKLIETLSNHLADSTISEIAELIEQDAAVMAQLLTVANTIIYNPHVEPLSSITHAIHQVGFRRIRSLAVSLMLLENSGRVGHPTEQREAAAHALCAGLLAQNWATALGTVDPEAAFACAALRQLGHIVLPAVSLELYREAQNRLKTKSEDIAFRSVFGVTPLELSQQLLAESRLAKQIRRGLRQSGPEMVASLTLSEDSRLLCIVDLGGRVARLALDTDFDHEAFERKSRSLARKYDRLLPGICDLVEPALQHTDERFASLTRTSASHVLPVAITLRIKSRRRHRDHATTGRETGLANAGLDGDPGPVAASAESIETAPLSAALLAANAQAAKPAAGWTHALAALCESYAAHEAWVFLPAPGGMSLVLANGVGDTWKEHRTRASLRSDERTVFGVCLTRHQTVAIHDTGEPNIQQYLPEWFRHGPSRPGAFMLLPLANGGHGLVLIGWSKPHRVAPTAAQAERAQQLLTSRSLRPFGAGEQSAI
jgi:hypothetical protein